MPEMEAEEEKDGVFWWMEKLDWMLLECNGVLRSCNLFFAVNSGSANEWIVLL